MQDDPPNQARRRSLALGIGGLAVAAALPVSADAQTAGGESRLETVTKRGKLLVATFSTNPPLCYADKDGKLIGFDIDIARIVAKGLSPGNRIGIKESGVRRERNERIRNPA